MSLTYWPPAQECWRQQDRAFDTICGWVAHGNPAKLLDDDDDDDDEDCDNDYSYSEYESEDHDGDIFDVLYCVYDFVELLDGEFCQHQHFQSLQLVARTYKTLQWLVDCLAGLRWRGKQTMGQWIVFFFVVELHCKTNYQLFLDLQLISSQLNI